MSTQFRTPVLRLVQGDCFTGQDKNQQGVPYTDKAGNPSKKFFIAAAGRKGDPEVEALKKLLEDTARAAFPQYFQGPAGACTNPSFSMKITDGDGFDNNGVSNATKQGFAGHWVFKFGSSFAPKCFAIGKYEPQQQLFISPGAPNPIPRGHYIRVAGTVESNGGGNGKPGLYVNLNMVEWNAIGDVIQSGPDAASIFGGTAPAAAPVHAPAPGAAPAPQPMHAPAPVAAGPIYTMTAAAGAYSREQYLAAGHTDQSLVAQGFMIVTQPAPAMAPAPQPAAPAPQPQMAPAPQAVAPHPGILTAAPAPLPPAGSAPTPPAPAPAAAAPGFRMADPAGVQYAAYMQAGWSDAQLVQNGIMVPA